MNSIRLDSEQLKKLVLASFMAEKDRDISAGLECIDDDFKVTEMVYSKNAHHFPSLTGKKLSDLMKLAFQIKGREYSFKSIVADEKTQTVIVEFIETYPDPKTGQIYRTPQISVCKVENGKIYRTRHYMDPRLSFEDISEHELDAVFSD